MIIRPLITGILSLLPGAGLIHYRRSKKYINYANARYCYCVWLRHMVAAHESGLLSAFPQTIAELGPGSSLGAGLAGLISGAGRYYGLDIVRYCANLRNLEIFDALVNLFQAETPIPDENEFPNVKPSLKSYDFPGYILSDERLKKALDLGRISQLRKELAAMNLGCPRASGGRIHYFAPWHDADITEPSTVDMIYSQAVLEHAEPLGAVYENLHKWLKPGGFMSHQIDFRSHGTAAHWNGHWEYSDFMWKLIKGGKPYLINREPLSAHLALKKKAGFKIIAVKKALSESGLKAAQLSGRFRHLSEDDLTVSGALIQSVKVTV